MRTARGGFLEVKAGFGYTPLVAFTSKYRESAHRHLEAVETLYEGHRRDVAGYLYGIAAECAVKQMAIGSAFPTEHDKNKTLHKHFPELELRDAIRGRRAAPLLALLRRKPAFMNHWDVAMRYADAEQIQSHWVDMWRAQARDAVGAMDT